MKEKIDWYQEVLDLEPGSKVFFPLAKLLVQNDEFARAIDTLQHGLERHPEFIEARLYLVELLHQHADIDTKVTINEHLSILVPLFERYAGFWQAWGNIKTGDSKLAISFLAALFQNNSLTLSEIFNKGLQAIDGSTKKAKESFGGGEGGALQDSEKEVGVKPSQDLKIQTNELNISETSSQEAIAEPTSTLECLYENQQVDENTPTIAKAVPVKAEQPAKPRITISITKPTIIPTENVVDDNDDMLLDEEEDDEGEERFSLRTRSMAEVLAEQGDYIGSLEIYKELINSATSSEEREDLQYRINTLSAYVGNAQEKPVVEEDAGKSPGKERILSVLETLAGRLESRVQS